MESDEARAKRRRGLTDQQAVSETSPHNKRTRLDPVPLTKEGSALVRQQTSRTSFLAKLGLESYRDKFELAGVKCERDFVNMSLDTLASIGLLPYQRTVFSLGVQEIAKQNNAFLQDRAMSECGVCGDHFMNKDLIMMECCPEASVCEVCLKDKFLHDIRKSAVPGCCNCSQPVSTNILTIIESRGIGCQLQHPGCTHPTPAAETVLVSSGCALNHKFCKACLVFDVERQLQRGAKGARCPRYAECGHSIMSDYLKTNIMPRPMSTLHTELLRKNDDIIFDRLKSRHLFLANCPLPLCGGVVTLPGKKGPGIAVRCDRCGVNLCSGCMKPLHYGCSCEEMVGLEATWEAFKGQIDSSKLSAAMKRATDNYAALCKSEEHLMEAGAFSCPHCGTIMIRTDGCSTMTCGADADDKGGTVHYIKGCGKKFDVSSAKPYKGKAELLRPPPPPEVFETGTHDSTLICLTCQSKVRGTAFECLHSPPIVDCPGSLSRHLRGLAASQPVQEVESEHPYRPNQIFQREFKFEGATSIRLVFDNRCSTKDCDVLTILEPGWRLHTVGKFSGTTGWPGSQQAGADAAADSKAGADGASSWTQSSGSVPPLTIEGDTLVVRFKSEAANEGWGWKLSMFPDKTALQTTGSKPVGFVSKCWPCMQGLLSGQPSAELKSKQKNLLRRLVDDGMSLSEMTNARQAISQGRQLASLVADERFKNFTASAFLDLQMLQQIECTHRNHVFRLIDPPSIIRMKVLQGIWSEDKIDTTETAWNTVLSTIQKTHCDPEELPLLDEIVCLLAHLSLKHKPAPLAPIDGGMLCSMFESCGAHFTLDAMKACPSGSLHMHGLRTLCTLGLRMLISIQSALGSSGKGGVIDSAGDEKSGSAATLPVSHVDSTEGASPLLCEHCVCPELCKAIESVWRVDESTPFTLTKPAIDGSWCSCGFQDTHHIRLAVVSSSSIRISYKGESQEFPRKRNTVKVDWSRFSEPPEGFGRVTLEYVTGRGRLTQRAEHGRTQGSWVRDSVSEVKYLFNGLTHTILHQMTSAAALRDWVVEHEPATRSICILFARG